MIVQCPNCQTRFHLDESKLSGESPWVRCSSCQEVFELSEADQQPDPKPPAEDKPAEPAPPAEDKPAEAAPPAPSLVEEATDQAEPEDGEQDLPLDQEPETPPVDEEQELDQETAELDEMALDLDQEPAAAEGKGRSGVFKVIFWLIALLVVAALASLGGLVAMDRLGLGGELIRQARQVPGVASVLDLVKVSAPGQPVGPNLASRMSLSNVRGFFRVNEHAGRIFVIQGKVDNPLSETQTAVRVRGRLQNLGGDVAAEEVVYAGTVLTGEELRRMTVEQMKIRLAQPVSPDGTPYVIPPKDSIPFVIVFSDLADNLSEFTAEVVGAQPYRSQNGTHKKP